VLGDWTLTQPACYCSPTTGNSRIISRHRNDSRPKSTMRHASTRWTTCKLVAAPRRLPMSADKRSCGQLTSFRWSRQVEQMLRGVELKDEPVPCCAPRAARLHHPSHRVSCERSPEHCTERPAPPNVARRYCSASTLNPQPSTLNPQPDTLNRPRQMSQHMQRAQHAAANPRAHARVAMKPCPRSPTPLRACASCRHPHGRGTCAGGAGACNGGCQAIGYSDRPHCH